MADRTIRRHGLVTVYLTPAGYQQAYVTASLAGGEGGPASTAEEAYRQIAEVLTQGRLQIVHERVFGSIDAEQEIISARKRVLAATGLAEGRKVTYIQGRPCCGSGLAGVNIRAVRAEDASGGVRPVYGASGELAGVAWRRNGAEFLLLQDFHGLAEGAQGEAREAQAGRMFERADAALRANGATYRDVVRTWIYLSELLAWYDQFNAARNEKYRRFGIMPAPNPPGGQRPLALPASTGIGGDNPHRAACVMDLLAVVAPPEARPTIEQMTNVMQEDAFLYGSAFSRGAYLRESDVASILISGTAAIDESGRTFCVGDFLGQMQRTFDNVEALIAEKGASLQDICDANVFLKHAEDLPAYRRFAAERGLEDMPAVIINSDICRPELLFEIDAVAIIPE